MFGRHPDIRDSRQGPAAPATTRTRPAAVLFVATGALAASVVQKALADVLPDRVRTVETDGVGLLDFDGPAAAAAAALNKC
jgi:hypothetical protein